MLLFNYKKMIGLQVLNSYYSALKSNDFSFIPEQTSYYTAARMGIKLKPAGSGFHLFAEVENDEKLAKNYTGSPVKMAFFMKLNNPFFVNFTDLPLQQDPEKIYYFSNQAVNKRKVFGLEKDFLLLNQNEYTSASDLIKTTKSNYNYVLDGNTGSKTANLVALDNDQTVTSKESGPVDGHYNFSFQLSGLPAGRYRLEIDGGEVDRFYYAHELSATKYYAVVELFSQVGADYAYFGNDNKLNAKEYCIAFKHRTTRWRYKVINRNGLDMAAPQIRESETPWEFTDVGDNVFVSNQPIPLKEMPVKGITLYGDKDDGSSVLIADLPNPGIVMVKPDPGDPSTVYSDVYVYL